MIYIKLILTAFFCGFVVIGGRLLEGEVPTYSAIFIRFFIGSMLMFLLLWHRNEFRMIKQLTGIQWLALLTGTLTGVILYNVFMLFGLETVPGARAGIIYGLLPLFTWIAAWIVLREKFTRWSILGSVVCLSGVIFALSHGSLEFVSNLVPGVGDLFLLASLLGWVVYSLLNTWLVHSFNSIFITALTCILATAMLFPLSMLEGLPSIVIALDLKEWSILIVQGVFATTLAYLWYCEGLEKLGAGKATLFLNIMPLGIIFMAALILNEPLYIAQVIGGILVCFGVWIAGKAKKQVD